MRGLLESGLPVVLYLVVVLGGVVLVAWALIMGIRVAYRWLRLHPAPPRGGADDRSDAS